MQPYYAKQNSCANSVLWLVDGSAPLHIACLYRHQWGTQGKSRQQLRLNQSARADETHKLWATTAGTSPYVRKDATTSRGSMHVTLVPFEAALPGERPRTDFTKVDVTDRGMKHLVALHVGLVAEGLGTHVTTERTSLLPWSPQEMRHCSGKQIRKKKKTSRYWCS